MIPTYKYYNKMFPTAECYSSVYQIESNKENYKIDNINRLQYESNNGTNVTNLIHLKDSVIDNINKKDCDISEKLLLVKDFLSIYSNKFQLLKQVLVTLLE